MLTNRSAGRSVAFTLIELLCVVAIIGILAALLLPALSQATARAKRIQCVSQLRESGVAFHSFAHDHNGRFPMVVPAQAGGSMEFVQNAYRLTGEFFFSFRHFQTLSNELVTPRMVVCPSDSRLPASSFALLKNENLSYFVGVDAGLGSSSSILAGDRNITNDGLAPATILELGRNHHLRWTEELHRFKGNLLFADGRVEEPRRLVAANNQVPATAKFFLPSVPSSPGSPSSPEPGNSAGAAAGSIPTRAPKPGGNSPTAPAHPNAMRTSATSLDQARGPDATKIQNPDVKPKRTSTNSPSGPEPSKPRRDETVVSPFTLWFSGFSHELPKKGAWLLYLLLMLLVAVVLASELRRRLRPKRKRVVRVRP